MYNIFYCFAFPGETIVAFINPGKINTVYKTCNSNTSEFIWSPHTSVYVELSLKVVGSSQPSFWGKSLASFATGGEVGVLVTSSALKKNHWKF